MIFKTSKDNKKRWLHSRYLLLNNTYSGPTYFFYGTEPWCHSFYHKTNNMMKRIGIIFKVAKYCSLVEIIFSRIATSHIFFAWAFHHYYHYISWRILVIYAIWQNQDHYMGNKSKDIITRKPVIQDQDASLPLPLKVKWFFTIIL